VKIDENQYRRGGAEKLTWNSSEDMLLSRMFCKTLFKTMKGGPRTGFFRTCIVLCSGVFSGPEAKIIMAVFGLKKREAKL
jgi:hypothetical protein